MKKKRMWAPTHILYILIKYYITYNYAIIFHREGKDYTHTRDNMYT